MQRGRYGESLADRAARSGLTPPPDPPRLPTESEQKGRRPAGDGHGRHCWVRDPPEEPGIWAGLLGEWRPQEGGWDGRVAHTVGGTTGPVLVETWLPAEQLKPE